MAAPKEILALVDKFSRNFFGIIGALQKENRVRLHVSPAFPATAHRVSEKKAVYRTAGKRTGRDHPAIRHGLGSCPRLD
jgi:hypothetical protein